MMMCRNNQDYITAFIEGYICAIIGERMTIAKVSEAELDNAKHSAEKYVEFQIEHSDFSEEEKEAMKKEYKLWTEKCQMDRYCLKNQTFWKESEAF